MGSTAKNRILYYYWNMESKVIKRCNSICIKILLKKKTKKSERNHLETAPPQDSHA